MFYRFLIRYFAAIITLSIYFSEFVIYQLQPSWWMDLKCNSTDHNCTKLMLIADPQIQGEVFLNGLLGFLFMWDGDQYLRSTFITAFYHFKPDVVVFLGDLMDEGYFATKNEFHRYVKRFAYIFQVDVATRVTQIVVPGDRDIGENKTYRGTAHKLRQFSHVFDQPPVIRHNNISFYKVNGITEYFHPVKNDTNLKIVVSHIPILSMAAFGPQVHKQIRPSVYFCGHEHLSQYEARRKNFDLIRKTKINQGEYVLLKFDKDFLYEIFVPTCSYGLGATQIGYGAAILENNTQQMKYTVMWSPPRFPSLLLYFSILVQLFCYTAFCFARFLLQRFSVHEWKLSYTWIKYCLWIYFGAALYCEWFVYVAQPYRWSAVECHSRDPTCTKILFIADPQIQGEYELPAPLNYVSEWDADRYLKATFSVALRHFRPHVLVFLGDLMDEGSVSTRVQYHQYVKRLANIFHVEYPILQIWLPGDNDIGGENEPIKKDKILEFSKVFVQPDVVTFPNEGGNITFYKVNGITHTYPRIQEEDLRDDTLRVALSHYSVTNKPLFGQQVNIELRPHIYFSAHDHESKYVAQDGSLQHRSMTWYPAEEPIEIDLMDTDEVYEISVPTCSYRMGKNDIGFGAAVIGNRNQHMKYTVFWSPRRYPSLFLYLAFLIVTVLYICTFVAVRICLRYTGSNVQKTDLYTKV